MEGVLLFHIWFLMDESKGIAFRCEHISILDTFNQFYADFTCSYKRHLFVKNKYDES
jgi:hypothetical protein